jgi:hypothetical protein
MPLSGTKIGHDVIIRPGETVIADTGRVFTPVSAMSVKEIVTLLHVSFLLRPVPLARAQDGPSF